MGGKGIERVVKFKGFKGCWVCTVLGLYVGEADFMVGGVYLEVED